jgi:uncharacterized protein
VSHATPVPRRALALLLLAALALFGLPWAAIPAADAQEASGSGLVISQVYGGGGNSGAPFTHDYVELFNRGDAPASLEDLSIQYASATGTGNLGANDGQLTELPAVTVQPGQYFLVQQAGGTVGDPLPAPDFVDPTPIGMAAGAGKVALVEGTASLGCNGGSTPCSAEQLARIIDLVGYGNANFFEGAGAAPTLSNTTAALRAGDGCTDTDSNAADFTAATPTPRNTASPLNVCEPVDNEPIVPSCFGLTIDEGIGGSVSLSATDADGTVVSAEITSEAVEGIALVNQVPASEVGGTLTVDLTVADTVEAGAYAVEVTFTNDDDEPQTASCVVEVVVQADLCEIPAEDVTLINEIQGDGVHADPGRCGRDPWRGDRRLHLWWGERAAEQPGPARLLHRSDRCGPRR